MANLERTRRRFISFLVFLVIVDAAAITYLLLPANLSIMAPQSEERRLQEEEKQLHQKIDPLRGIGDKIKEAREEIAGFYNKRLPARYSDLVEELGKLAEENKVDLSAVRYKTENTSLDELMDLQMEASINGSYANVARFINAVEADKNVFFIIDSVQLGGEKSQSNVVGVRLGMKFETYLRSEQPPSSQAETQPSAPPQKSGTEGQ